jgi:hypothetical protein
MVRVVGIDHMVMPPTGIQRLSCGPDTLGAYDFEC